MAAALLHGVASGIAHSVLDASLLRNLKMGIESKIGDSAEPLAAAEEAWLRGWCSDARFRRLLGYEGLQAKQLGYGSLTYTAFDDNVLGIGNGIIHDINNPLRYLYVPRQEIPSPDEIRVLLNRGVIKYDLAVLMMMMNGYADSNVIKVMLGLRYEIPPTSDLIRWAVRHAFDVDIVEQFKYLDEVPTQLYALADAQGLGGPTGVQYPAGIDNHGNKIPAHEAKWFDMEWVAHWILPSTGQGYEMLHRLYPNSRFGPSPTADKDTQFTQDQLRLLLRAQDIPPFWRDRLIALSYSPLTRVDVRRMYELGVIGVPEVYHAYRQNGYDDNNAWLLTQYTQRQAENKIKDQWSKPMAKLVCKGYQIGILNKDQAEQKLKTIFKDPNDVEHELQQCYTENQLNRISKQIKVIEKGYVTGRLSYDEANKDLLNLGIPLDRATEYFHDWDIEVDLRDHRVSAGEWIKWYKAGLANANEVLTALINLGYNAHDASTTLRYADQELAIKAERAARAAAKENKAKLKELASKVKQEQQQAKADLKAAQAAAKKAKTDQLTAIKEMLKGINTKNMKVWYVNHLITKSDMIHWLALMGWEESTIDTWLKELEKEIASGEILPAHQPKSPPTTTEG